MFLGLLANVQVRPRDIPELQLISRQQRSVSIEKMAAVVGGYSGIIPTGAHPLLKPQSSRNSPTRVGFKSGLRPYAI